ncbi:MAG: prolipoprotein diacylglyceryl transferase [Planctomycetota bacterium]
MHPYLLEFRLPLFIKTLFALMPMFVHVLLVVGGIALMFFPEQQVKDGDDAARKKARKSAWFFFATGLTLLVIGMLGIGVNALINDANEEKAVGALASVAGTSEAPTLHDLIEGGNGRAQRFANALRSVTNRPEFADTLSKQRADALIAALQPFVARDVAHTVNTAEEMPPLSESERNIAVPALTAAYTAVRDPIPASQAPLAPVRLPAYGVMIMLGFIFAILVCYLRVRIHGTDPNVIIDLGIVCMIAGILGARLWHVIEYWNVVYAVGPNNEPRGTWEALVEAVQVQKGGLVFYGGFLLASFAAWCYLRIRKLPILYYLDLLAVAVPIGQAFGRIGCFMNGCCWGVGCAPDSKYAWAYPWLTTFYDHGLGIPGEAGVVHQAGAPVLMSQFIDSANGMILFILMTIFYEKLARYRGETASILFVFYGINRLITQGLRADVPTYAEHLGSAQWTSITIIVGGLVAWAYFRFLRKNRVPTGMVGLKYDRAKMKQAAAALTPKPA